MIPVGKLSALLRQVATLVFILLLFSYHDVILRLGRLTAKFTLNQKVIEQLSQHMIYKDNKQDLSEDRKKEVEQLLNEQDALVESLMTEVQYNERVKELLLITGFFFLIIYVAYSMATKAMLKQQISHGDTKTHVHVPLIPFPTIRVELPPDKYSKLSVVGTMLKMNCTRFNGHTKHQRLFFIF